MSRSVWDYLLELRQKKVYTNKQKKFLSHIAIYTNNLQVYKVIVFADPSKKNGKRYGVNQMITIHTPEHNDKNISFPLLKNELAGSEDGLKLFIHNFRMDDMNVYKGEDFNLPYQI